MPGTPPASARFRTLVLGLAIYSALACAITFTLVIREGSRARGNDGFGWSSSRQPDGAYALRVIPDGPAAALLRTGDVVVAMDGDRRVGRMSPSAYRQFVEGDAEYSLTVRRDGQEVTVRLRPAVPRDPVKRRFMFSIWFGATVWCVV